MESTARHQMLVLDNFTVFSHAELEFVPGMNIIIGENGTGKTHLLKAIYAWQMACHLSEGGREAAYSDLFKDVYRVDSLTDLVRDASNPASVRGVYGQTQWRVGINGSAAAESGKGTRASRPVFIPAIEMMALARNMDGILRDYADFDRTCFDFVAMLTAKERGSAQATPTMVANSLAGLLEGQTEWDPEAQRFYLARNGTKRPFQLLAEGERKIAGLTSLVRKGFISPGTTLLWDEPEVSLNPQWMDELAEQMVALAAEGVQVIMATHSYVILKSVQLSLKSREKKGLSPVEVKHLSLAQREGGVEVESHEDFGSLKTNAILDRYEKMMSLDMALEDT